MILNLYFIPRNRQYSNVPSAERAGRRSNLLCTDSLVPEVLYTVFNRLKKRCSTIPDFNAFLYTITMQTIGTTLKKVASVQFTYILYALAFSIPLFFNSAQLITGTLVNSLLFLSAKRLLKKEIIPVVILPSLGAAAHGVLFGPQTVFLYYFLPFIWIGNYVLIQMFSQLHLKFYVVRMVVSAGAKFLVLQLFAQLYFHLNIVPSLFVASMGYMQLITALAGGLVAFGVAKYTSYERR